MRNLLVLAVLVVAPPAVMADEVSNPAFLGVGMHDSGPGGPCTIDTVTKDSGASAAGVRPYDVIVNLDASPITNCDSLVTAIQGKEPGQTVKIEIRRSDSPLTLQATLPSRADVLRKRFVGQPVPMHQGSMLVRVDDDKAVDLSSRGKTTIVGWFDQSRCVTCATAFSTIQQWARSRSSINVVGVTSPRDVKSVGETVTELKPFQRKFDVPLLVADSETFGELSITDVKRIHFMVIDCRGVVSYATPLKPDADDKNAVLEELYTATEQAARRIK